MRQLLHHWVALGPEGKNIKFIIGNNLKFNNIENKDLVLNQPIG